MIEALPAGAVAEIAEQLETDDAVALIEDLDEDDQQAVLAELEPEDRAAIESALAYPEETAGRLMSRDLVAVPEHLTVGDLIDYLREDARPDRPSSGKCSSSIRSTTRSAPASFRGSCARRAHIALADVMKRDQTLIPVTMDQEEVALRFQKYALISAAVVDESGRLVGQITVDDMVHIIAGGSRRGRAAAVRRGRWRHQRADPRSVLQPGPLADRQSRHGAGRQRDHRLFRRGDRTSWWRWRC